MSKENENKKPEEKEQTKHEAMKAQAKTLYELDLHEMVSWQNKKNNTYVTAMRVPGGWLYTTISVLQVERVNEDGEKKMAQKEHVTSVFVPMDSEFNK